MAQFKHPPILIILLQLQYWKWILLALPSHSSKSDGYLEDGLSVYPPNGFTDSQEFSDAECDRDIALDLEVQQTLGNKANEKIQQEELASLLARWVITLKGFMKI